MCEPMTIRPGEKYKKGTLAKIERAFQFNQTQKKLEVDHEKRK